MQKRFNRNDFIILCYFKVHNKFISIFLRKSYNGFYMPIYLTFDSWLKSMMMVSLVYAYTSHVQRKQDLTDFWQRHSIFWHFLVHTLYTMLFYNFLKVKKSGTPRSHPSFHMRTCGLSHQVMGPTTVKVAKTSFMRKIANLQLEVP